MTDAKDIGKLMREYQRCCAYAKELSERARQRERAAVATYQQIISAPEGPPGGQKSKFVPWFLHPHRLTREQRILFGHWSTLGYHVAENTWALDTGCLWGGKLTALRIDVDPPVPTHLPCPRQQDPSRFA
ncbi:MAG TPA: hypothetical protein EYP90_05755 [Chromatiaceae bacterium]|nr:hypothetical protein [Chromatiaceae bacterium]